MHWILCDDNKKFLQILEEKIQEICQKHNFKAELTTYDSPDEMLNDLKGEMTAPAVFLDIDMPGLNGFEVARYLQNWNQECCIVFVSNRDDLVFQSLVYHPFFFIRKTHLDEELEPQLLELEKKMNRKIPKIELQTGRRTIELSMESIWFVESEKNYLLFYREKDGRDDAIRARMKMTEAEKLLELGGFIRTQKGYMVNMQYIYRLRETEVLLLNGKSVPVSRSYMNQVRAKIMGWL